MKRLFAFLLTVSLVCSAWAQANGDNVKTYQLKIKDFTELTVANSINVIYRSSPDSAGMAVFRCAPEKANLIAFNNDKGKLKIMSEADSPSSQLPTITIYSLALVRVTNWGDSTVTIAANNPGSSFRAKVIGNGHIEVPTVWATKVEASVEAGNGHIYFGGKAQSAKFTIVSAGTIAAGSLEAADVKCVMMGTGSVDCFATNKLNVFAAGSGKVYYRGNPRVQKRGLGVDLIHIED